MYFICAYCGVHQFSWWFSNITIEFCYYLSDMAKVMTSSTHLRKGEPISCLPPVLMEYIHLHFFNLSYGQKPQLRLGKKPPTPHKVGQHRSPYKKSTSKCAQTHLVQQSPA